MYLKGAKYYFIVKKTLEYYWFLNAAMSCVKANENLYTHTLGEIIDSLKIKSLINTSLFFKLTASKLVCRIQSTLSFRIRTEHFYLENAF